MILISMQYVTNILIDHCQCGDIKNMFCKYDMFLLPNCMFSNYFILYVSIALLVSILLATASNVTASKKSFRCNRLVQSSINE